MDKPEHIAKLLEGLDLDEPNTLYRLQVPCGVYVTVASRADYESLLLDWDERTWQSGKLDFSWLDERFEVRVYLGWNDERATIEDMAPADQQGT